MNQLATVDVSTGEIVAQSSREIALPKYDDMCRAIDVCHRVDEVKDIRDKMRALEHYAAQARNLDAEKCCADIRIRAEMKAGALIKDQPKAKPGIGKGSKREKGKRGGKVTSLVQAEGSNTLESLGVSADQSSQWQKMATNKKAVEKYLKEHPDVPTTAGAVAAATGKAAKPKQSVVSPVSDDALWLWGRLGDLVRREIDTRNIAKGCDDATRLDLLKFIQLLRTSFDELTKELA